MVCIFIYIYIHIMYLFYMNHWWIDQSRWDGFSFLASNPGGFGRWNPRRFRLSRRWTSCRSRSKLKSSAWRKVGIVRMGKLMRSCKLTARPGSLVRKNKSTHQPLVPVEIFCNQVRLNFLDCTRKNRDTFGMYIYIYISGQIIATSAEVTLNGGLVRESPQNPLNSGLGIIVICPDIYICVYMI